MGFEKLECCRNGAAIEVVCCLPEQNTDSGQWRGGVGRGDPRNIHFNKHISSLHQSLRGNIWLLFSHKCLARPPETSPTYAPRSMTFKPLAEVEARLQERRARAGRENDRVRKGKRERARDYFNRRTAHAYLTADACPSLNSYTERKWNVCFAKIRIIN